MEHKFKFNEQDVTMRTGTNRDRAARRIASRKLLDACGGVENVSEIDQDAMWEYVTFITHTTPLDIIWWRDVAESSERLYEGYALFADDDSELSDALRGARRELDNAREKKATLSSPKPSK